MKVYIGYKYTKISDKQKMIADLEKISDSVKGLGHEPFILGRDVKHWKHVHFFKLMPILFKNLSARDYLLAYINDEAPSNGLMVEVILAKLLRKKMLLVIQPEIKADFYRSMIPYQIEINSLDNLVDELKKTNLG